MTLTELKARATELGLTPDDVRAYGSLAKKATWEKAIAEFKVWKDAVNTHCEQMDIPQWTYPEDEPETVESISVTVNQSNAQTDTETCPVCEGTGIFKQDDDTCYECDGKGYTNYDDIEEPCPVCEGVGIFKPNDNTCGCCYGTGVVPRIDEPLEELPFDPTHALIDGEWVLVSEVVNPSLLPNLVKTDERFEYWQPWMLPGETFNTGRQSYTILYFDPSGNCNAKGTDDRWHSFRIETIVNTATEYLVEKLPTSEPIPPIQPEVEMKGWHRWDEKLKVWVKENPEETLKDCYQPESESYRQQLLKRMKPYVGNCIQLEDFEQLKDKPLDEPIAAIYLGLLEESERMLTDALLAV